MSTYRRIAAAWLNAKPYEFTRNKKRFRADWRAEDIDPSTGGVQIDARWSIMQLNANGYWRIVHIERNGTVNGAALAAAEYIDLI